MGIELKTYDVAEHLETEEDIRLYLEAAFEDGDPQLIRAALADVVRARGMAETARRAGIARASLYKALGENGNPTFDTLTAILGTFGMRLAVTPKSAEV